MGFKEYLEQLEESGSILEANSEKVEFTQDFINDFYKQIEKWYGKPKLNYAQINGKNLIFNMSFEDGHIPRWDGKKRYTLSDLESYFIDPRVWLIKSNAIAKTTDYYKIKILNKKDLVRGKTDNYLEAGKDFLWKKLDIEFKILYSDFNTEYIK